MPAVPIRVVIAMPPTEQAGLRQQLRRARWGGWLYLHIVLLFAQQQSPADIAAWLFCARSTVSAAAHAWQAGRRPWEPDTADQDRALRAGLTPARRRSLRALLKQVPARHGWTRTRGSGAPRAASLRQRRGWCVSAETVRRWRHALGWRWQRATHVAQDNDPLRAAKLARILFVCRRLRRREALLFADEMDLALLAKPGYPWREKGTQTAVMTPGKNAQRYVAAAWGGRGAALHVVPAVERAVPRTAGQHGIGLPGPPR